MNKKNLNKVIFKMGKSIFEYNNFLLRYSLSIKKVYSEESFRNFIKILHLKNTLFKEYLNDMVFKHTIYKNEQIITSIDSSLGNDKYNFNDMLHRFLNEFEEIWFIVYDEQNGFSNMDESMKKYISTLSIPSSFMRYIYE